jgi:hypothetical protein
MTATTTAATPAGSGKDATILRLTDVHTYYGIARTAFDRESVDPEAQINLVNRTIGPVWALKTQAGLIQVVLIMPKGNQQKCLKLLGGKRSVPAVHQ